MRPVSNRVPAWLALPLLLAGASALPAAEPTDAQAQTELRNTVINLLQGLVERGVLTREQAELMVRDAQARAAADAAARAAIEAAEQNAVRVPYVPEIVKQEIRKQVEQDLAANVTSNVLQSAKDEGWGVPAALPDWVRRMNWSGDLRLRGQGDLFASDNVTLTTFPPQDLYLDYQRINEAGGIAKAGLSAFTNTTEDRERLRLRMRLGFDVGLGWGWSLGGRITSGNLRDPVSTNQTLGNTGARYQTGIDLAYLQWAGNSATGRHVLNVSGGRIRNPWQSTDLLFDQDLNFEGAAAQYKLGLKRDDPYSHFAFLTLGAFPLQEVELAHDKWLLAGQLGYDWKFEGGSRWRLAAGYFDYRHIAGRRNDFGSQKYDYTAPQFVQRGNTMFPIREDNDGNPDLYALAADYRIVDVNTSFDWRISPGYKIGFSADAVRNLGYDRRKVFARTESDVEGRNDGYQGEITFGSADMARASAWRASLGYRYVESDAVLDAFTDSDFHLGGTDAQGYYFGLEYAATPRVQLRARYLSANEIDKSRLGIDVLQLDLTASF